MVKFALSLVALAMTAASVAATPAATSKTTFSFEKWVEDIIANPDTALTADEALAAAHAADVVGSVGLQRRVNCERDQKRAPGRAAAACVEDLARKGNSGVNCVVTGGHTSMCAIGGAQIVGSKAESTTQSANCNDIARTAGIIFDNCWRADDTVLGDEICITNRKIQVNIVGY